MKPRTTLFLLALAAIAMLVADASCTDASASGMTMTVQRWDSVNKCFGTVAGDTPAPGVKLGTCPAAATTDLVGGVDLIRMVVSYGDLQFSSSTQPPTPTISMTLDGADTPSGASVSAAQAANPTVFFAVLMAPARPVNEMYLTASVVTGFTHPPVGPFRVNTPTVAVSVQECATDGAPCAFVAGVGGATVAVTAPGTVATTGTITWTLNGILQPGSVPVALTPAPNVVNTVTGVAFAPVPLVPQNTPWVVSAQVGAASGMGPGATIGAPAVTIAVAQCAMDGGICTLVADVGTVAVSVSVPGLVPTMGTVTSSLNGVPQPGSSLVSLVRSPNANDLLSGVVYIPVPAAADGASWTLAAQVGTSEVDTPNMTLRAPVISAALAGCAAGTCTVTAGATVPFTVTVPLGMAAQQAVVTATVDSAATAPVTVNLTTTEISAGTMTGTVGLVAPAKSGAAWIIDTNVGGYNAPTVIAKVQ
jgi:hypothetical protein